MADRDEVDRLLELITVDCENLAEQVTAFYETFAEAVPVSATLLGLTIRVSCIGIAEHGEELTARCRREGVAQDLRLSDVVFPPEAEASWLHSAHRRCLGLAPYPAAMPAGWKPSWL